MALSTGVLHTLSSKANVNVGVTTFIAKSKQIDLLNSSIAYLRGQEQKLYAWVGANSYPQFMSILRQLFAEAAQDAQVLEKFKKGNLNNLVSAPIGMGIAEGQTVTITCKAAKPIDVIDLLSKNLAVHTPDVDVTVVPGQELKITFDYNATNIKNALNVLDKRRGFTKFDPNTSTMVNVNKKLRDMVDSGQMLSMVINGKSKDVEIKQEFGRDRSNPFGFTTDSFKKAINDPVLLKEIEAARDLVKSTMESMCSGGSNEMKEAFQKVWNEKIGSDINNFLFFSKGKNIKSGIGGAMQEFASAMLFEYIALKKKTIQNGKIATILGNIAGSNGEQPKTDVEILESIGIQVKAYNQNSLVDIKGNARMMTTNIHPAGLDAGLLGYGLNIGDAIVQCCFNSSNGYETEYFAELIKQAALAQAMNFTTNELNVDTVCFYFLDAQYLVPGSVILGRLQIKEPQVSIRQPAAIGDDDYFKNKEYTANYVGRDGNLHTHVVENFVQYWNGYPLDSSDENENYYDALYNKSISIDVKFDYQFMYGSNFSVY